MDPFDEFEFKPLTEGLGFHKKTSSLKESTQKTSLVEEELNRAVPEPPPGSMTGDAKAKSQLNVYDDLLQSINRPTIKDMAAQARAAFPLDITEPLPRATGKNSGMSATGVGATSANIEMPKPQQRAPQIPTPAPGIERTPIRGTLSDKTFIDKPVGARRGAADSPMGGLEKAPVCVPSALLDFVFVIALSLVFVVTLLLVTGVSLTTVITNVQVDTTTQLSMLLLFVAVMQIYVVMARSFFGRTLGEWTFEHQMGSKEKQASPFYPMLVAWRSLVITATGIVLLPLLSLIFRRDLTAALTGLQLYRQRT